MGVSFELDTGVIDGAADGALARMPQAQEGFQGPNDEGNASDPAAALPTNTPQVGDGEKDALGMAWNAAEHATGKDGKGVKTATGEWRKKRRSKIGGATKSATSATAPAVDASGKPVLTDAQKQQAMLAGVVVAECIFQSAQAFGGKEWEPRLKPIDERTNMQGAWGTYFVAKGITDMPPSLVLLVALGGYMLPRFTNHEEFPDTRTRVQKVREWVGVRLDRFKQRRATAKNQAPATKEIGKHAEGTENANAKL